MLREEETVEGMETGKLEEQGVQGRMHDVRAQGEVGRTLDLESQAFVWSHCGKFLALWPYIGPLSLVSSSLK